MEIKMPRFLIGSTTGLSILVLSACDLPTEYVEVKQQIPESLLAPVVIQPRPVEKLTDVGLVLADYKEGLDKANEQIVAIGCIVNNPC